MKHLRFSVAGRVFCLLLLLLFCWVPTQAEEPLRLAQSGHLMVPSEPVRAGSDQVLTRHRRRIGLNRLFVFETSPLGDRIPVILVPGRAEEFQHDSWWKKFENFTEHEEFNRHYKLYAYIYDSKEELDVQAADLVYEMGNTFGHLPPERKAILLTYSLGGAIAREAFEDAHVRDRVQTIFGIAVPFHGSPLFEPEWFAKYMQPENRSPIRKYWDRTLYRAYLFNKSNLTRGLKWDNFDGSKPQFYVERDLRGDQIIPSIAPYQERETTRAFKDRLIVYASYLENSFTHSGQPYNDRRLPRYVLDRSIKLPRELVATVLPIYGLNVHSVFAYTNHQLATLPSYSAEHPEGKNTGLYRFNDGAIPLSSMLYLPARTLPYEDDFDALVAASDVCMSRIFVNIDHTHIGGYSLFESRIRAEDILEPELGEKTPHDWLYYDLMRLAPTHGEQTCTVCPAVEPEAAPVEPPAENLLESSPEPPAEIPAEVPSL